MKLNPKFVVDENGQRAAVLLPVEEYDRLLEALENRLDAEDLEDAVREESEGGEKQAKPRTGKELVAALRATGLVGMWKDRTDIGDSSEFARELRAAAQRRNRG